MAWAAVVWAVTVMSLIFAFADKGVPTYKSGAWVLTLMILVFTAIVTRYIKAQLRLRHVASSVNAASFRLAARLLANPGDKNIASDWSLAAASKEGHPAELSLPKFLLAEAERVTKAPSSRTLLTRLEQAVYALPFLMAMATLFRIWFAG